ncbi:MAG: hypothetical protein CL732_01000 [Chloroflexi bacterium]|nr:hypothetical protein [Chloroflexota bacterium]
MAAGGGEQAHAAVAGQGAAHGLAAGAHQAGQFVLSDGNLYFALGLFSVELVLRQFQELFRDTCGHVQEGQIAHHLVGVAQAVGQERGGLGGHLGVLAQELD